MRKILLLSIFIIFCVQYNGAAQLRSTTSEVFELSSIAFRLAEAEEYMQCPIPSYAKDIDKYFASYSDHELIEYIKEIRAEYLIGYDAVANAAAYLAVHNGGIVMKPDVIIMHNGGIAINPEFDISRISEIDERWTVEVYDKYVDLLNDFYKDSNFNKFYSDHEKLYNVATSRADELLSNLDTKWFSSFFGEELGDIRVLVSLCNGKYNYAFSLLNKDDGFGIIIGCGADSKGLPAYSMFTPTIIIHELSHGFTNKLINGIWDDIESAALTIYPHVEERMLDIAIGFPKTVMTEWFTRLCTNMYLRENPATMGWGLTQEVAQQQREGFIWMVKSVDFMEDFYENRGVYPAIKDYMPRIAAFINNVAADYDQVITDSDNLPPYVIETLPADGSVVSSDINRIVIKFSEPMDTRIYGYGRTNEEGVLQVPELKGDKEFWQDSTTFVIPINTRKMQKGKRYGIKLTRNFLSEKQHRIVKDYIFYFNTSE